MVKLSAFDYSLPKELIAQTPARPRNHSRLLVYDRHQDHIIDDHFYNLEKYLSTDTTLVLNNSKVEKCRLNFDGLEIFVTDTINPTTIRALVRPGKKLPLDKELSLSLKDGRQLLIKVVEVDAQGLRTLNFNLPLNDEHLDPFRLTPFPPYIKQNEKLSSSYQTIYAKPLGSKAAPTAGLHFTNQQLAAIKRQWPVAELTLHVGLGTFAPVKASDINDHKLHSEWFEVTSEVADKLNKATHITAVGTTSVRTLESLSRPFKAASGQTDIFIKPGYKFHSVDAMVTNFHLPKSSLLILISAFIGSVDKTMDIYQHAVNEKYRFYSFGDAMLIL